MPLRNQVRGKWKSMSFDELSKVVIASDGVKHGCILWAVGAHITFELEQHNEPGLADLGLADAPFGISIWEGRYIWGGPSLYRPDCPRAEPKGTFRQPNQVEWALIQQGLCPWPEALCTGSESILKDDSAHGGA